MEHIRTRHNMTQRDRTNIEQTAYSTRTANFLTFIVSIGIGPVINPNFLNASYNKGLQPNCHHIRDRNTATFRIASVNDVSKSVWTPDRTAWHSPLLLTDCRVLCWQSYDLCACASFTCLGVMGFGRSAQFAYPN